MRNSARIGLAALAVLALAASPGIFRVSAADKTQDALLEIQRDIATMQGQIQDLQKAQADQITQMKTLLQQAVEASTRSSEATAQSQRSLSDSLTTQIKNAMADQQTKITGPIADLSAKFSELSQEMTAVQNTTADTAQRVNRLESNVKDILTAVTTPPVAPPPAPGTAPQGAANTGTGAPPGTTPMSLREAAERDYAAGNSLAMSELADYIKYFHDDAWAPTAQMRMAELYDQAKQYEDSADAYDAVVTRFPTNNRTAEAAYMKGMELKKAKKTAEAKEQFRNVVSTYPGTEWATRAKAELAPTGSASRRRKE